MVVRPEYGILCVRPNLRQDMLTAKVGCGIGYNLIGQ